MDVYLALLHSLEQRERDVCTTVATCSRPAEKGSSRGLRRTIVLPATGCEAVQTSKALGVLAFMLRQQERDLFGYGRFPPTSTGWAQSAHCGRPPESSQKTFVRVEPFPREPSARSASTETQSADQYAMRTSVLFRPRQLISNDRNAAFGIVEVAIRVRHCPMAYQ